MPDRAIDTIEPVGTPEGISLNLRPAGPVSRAAAWLLDTLIRWAVIFALVFTLGWLQMLGMTLLVLIWFLITWWYPVLFEVLADGATPGKRVLALRVLHDDGTPIGWGASIVRNLLRQIDFLPLAYGAGLTAMICNRRFQRLGDLAAGSLVVHAARPALDTTAISQGPARAPALALGPEEQQVLLSLTERLPRLNPERARELAALMQPVTAQPPEKSLETLEAWARWIRGQEA